MNAHIITPFQIVLLPALLALMSVCVPLFAHAQSLSYINDFLNQVDFAIRLYLVPLLLALAVVLFIWGVIKYFIYGAADENARATGRIYMIYALIGLTAIVAVWGFVNLLIQMLGIQVQTAPTINNYLP